MARRGALTVLYGLASRTGPDQRSMLDTTADKLLVPYLSRLTPHLSDPDTPVRSMTFYLVASFNALRPAPPALLRLTLDLLKDPSSTAQPLDSTEKTPPRKAPSLGPALLWIILPAGATYTRDLSTGITVGCDSPEVQQAVIDFIRRPDQTPESRAETLRALELAQAKNPAVIAALLPWLTTSDLETRRTLLGELNVLPLDPGDYTRARVAIGNLAVDVQTPAELRSAASALLTRWTNDQPRATICPAPPGVASVTP